MSGISVTNDFDISAADGVTTVFAYTFFAYDSSQIKVYSILDNIETPITTGFTVALNSDYVGGTITFSVPPAAAVGEILRRREVAYTQTTEFTDLIRYKETGIERALNAIVMQIQQVYSKVTRAIRYSEAAGVSSAIVDSPEDGKALMFSGTTGRIVAGPDATDITSAQSYAVAALASQNAAATSEANAQAWAITAQNAATGINWTKARAASTANINISSPGATIDGVTLSALDRVLLKDQSTASQNGIYIWNGAAVAMTRAADMDTWQEVVSKVVVIEEGSLNADIPYISTVNTGGTLGTTSITFIVFQPPLQDGAVSTTAKIADGIVTYAKIDGDEIASSADIIAGTASKLVDAATINAAGLIKMTDPVSVGTGTTKDFTIPSGVKRITLHLNGVSLNTTDNMVLQLGGSGGVETSGYTGSASTFSSATAATAGTGSSGMAFANAGQTAATAYSGDVVIEKISTSNTYSIRGQLSTGGVTLYVFSGQKTITGEVQTVRLTSFAASNFDAGTVGFTVEY